MALILEEPGQRTTESFDGNSALAPALMLTFIGEQESTAISRR